jgi:hypothetical protein
VDEFRLQWPSGKFSRDSAFRSGFQQMADRAVCVAKDLQALRLPATPTPRPGQTPFRVVNPSFETNFQAALAAFMTTMQKGREGVESRNVSDYRDWNRDVDTRLGEIKGAVDGIFRPPN